VVLVESFPAERLRREIGEPGGKLGAAGENRFQTLRMEVPLVVNNRKDIRLRVTGGGQQMSADEFRRKFFRRGSSRGRSAAEVRFFLRRKFDSNSHGDASWF